MKLGNRLTESKDIAKTIGYFLKEKGKDVGLKQEDWANKVTKNTGKKMEQGNLNSYLNGIRTSPDIEFYWKFAEAIPISRSEFDRMVENAKQKVLGSGGKMEVDPKVAFFSEVGVTDKNKQDAILKMIEAFKDV